MCQAQERIALTTIQSTHNEQESINPRYDVLIVVLRQGQYVCQHGRVDRITDRVAAEGVASVSNNAPRAQVRLTSFEALLRI